MNYKKIPYVKKEVSEIILGTATEPFLSGGDASQIIDAALAAGINTIDTARNYKMSEKSIGDYLEKTGRRDEVVILSKCAHPDEKSSRRVNEKDIREDYEISTQLLRDDFIDIYLLHRDDETVEAGVAVEVLNALHSEGKIGAFGGSNWRHERIEEANEYAYKHDMIPFTVSSPNYGLADQYQDPWGGGCVTIAGPSNVGARKWYRENQMPVIAYSSLGRGLFSGKMTSADSKNAAKYMDEFAIKGYLCDENIERLKRAEEIAGRKGVPVSQIAMNYIFNRGINAFAVVSTTKPARLKENVDALEIKLTKEEYDYLDLGMTE